MKYYKPKYFQSFELVDPTTWHKMGDNAFSLLNADLLRAIDDLHEKIGQPITCNNWFPFREHSNLLSDAWRERNGVFIWRGLRTDDCKEGADLSMHRVGCAFDLIVSNKDAESVRQFIIKNYSGALNGITRMEAGRSWVHVDASNIPDNMRPHLFNP